MKKPYISINLLCILIIVILIFSVAGPVWYFGKSFLAGFNDSFSDEATTSVIDNSFPLNVTISQDKVFNLAPTDTLQTTDGSVYPMSVVSGIVYVPEKSGSFPLFIISVLVLLTDIVLVIVLLCYFAKFIVNINKGIIFSPSNIRLLNRFGWLLLVICALQITNGIINEYIVSTFDFKTSWHTLSANWSFPAGNLLLGLLALLMSKTWQRGMDLEQEQSLTI